MWIFTKTTWYKVTLQALAHIKDARGCIAPPSHKLESLVHFDLQILFKYNYFWQPSIVYNSY